MRLNKITKPPIRKMRYYRKTIPQYVICKNLLKHWKNGVIKTKYGFFTICMNCGGTAKEPIPLSEFYDLL